MTYLGALNGGILLAAVVAGVIALLLGVVLVRQITAPLRGLRSAAHAIAGGDLTQRVPVTSQDELGDVAKAFNRMAETLERNEMLRRHMMADIAHELRTPLTVMQGQVEALLDGVFPSTPEHLSPIHDQTVLMSRLVSDLRDLALAEAGNLRLEYRSTDLGELVRRVATAVEPAALERGVTLEVGVRPGLPPVYADGDRLRQVLHNLLGYALRHTPAGGKVHVTVDRTSQAERGRCQTVSVSDTGTGIAPEELPHIFDRFYQADRRRAQEEGGTGLGLTIARSIVEAHGGRIWAASQPGSGTQITFGLPDASQNTASAL